jgi:hypothetical protein
MTISDLTNGTTQILFGADEVEGQTPNTLTLEQARGAALVVGIATAIGSSMYTRQRAYEGKAPIASVLF